MRRISELAAISPGEKRVLVLGDSSAFGGGLNHGQDWPAVLEKELRAAGVKVTIMNGASPGEDMALTYQSFKWFMKRLQVDIVIVHTGWSHTIVHPFIPENEFSPEASARKLFPNFPANLNHEMDLGVDQSRLLRQRNHFFAPQLLVSLSKSSPLANHINSEWLPRLDNWLPVRESEEQKAKVAKPSTDQKISNQFEIFMLYLGLVINEADKADIPVILVRPFSAFRIDGLMKTSFWEDYNVSAFGFDKSEYPLMRNAIKQMDTVIDLFVSHGKAELIDPTATLLKHVPPGSGAEKIRVLLHDHNHYSAKASEILASFISNQLVARNKLRSDMDGSWTQPNEVDATIQLKQPRLKYFNGHRTIISIVFSIVVVLIGCLLQTTISKNNDLGLFEGWVFTLGIGIPLVIFTIISQFISNVGMCSLVAVISLTIIVATGRLKLGFPNLGGVKRSLPKLAVMGVVAAALMICGSALAVFLIKNVYYSSFIRYMALTGLQVVSSLHNGDPAFLQNIVMLMENGEPLYIAAEFKDYFAHGAYYVPGLPSAAAALSQIAGMDSENSLLLLVSAVTAAMTLPPLWIGCIGKMRWCVKGTMFCLALIGFLAGLFLIVPVMQLAALSVALMLFASLAVGPLSHRAALFIVSAGAALLLPVPAWIFMIMSIVVIWVVGQSKSDKSAVASLLTGIIMVLIGKSALPYFPALSRKLFEVANYYMIPTVAYQHADLVFSIIGSALSVFTFFILKSSQMKRGWAIGFIIIVPAMAAIVYVPHLYKLVPLLAQMLIVTSLMAAQNNLCKKGRSAS